MPADRVPPTEQRNELAALLGPFWTADRTRRALGLATSVALQAASADGTVLALTTSDGATVYPVFQFQTAADRVVVLPALTPMLRALRTFDPWTVGVFLHTPAPELDGQTPLDAARSGARNDELAALAQTVARELAAGDHG